MASLHGWNSEETLIMMVLPRLDWNIWKKSFINHMMVTLLKVWLGILISSWLLSMRLRSSKKKITLTGSRRGSCLPISEVCKVLLTWYKPAEIIMNGPLRLLLPISGKIAKISSLKPRIGRELWLPVLKNQLNLH